MPSPFRDDIPAYHGPPDRDVWAAKHGVAPYSLGRVRETYVSRARAAVRRDLSTIEAEGANHAQGQLFEVCECVQFDAVLPDTTMVFFDPVEETFWAYPRVAK